MSTRVFHDSQNAAVLSLRVGPTDGGVSLSVGPTDGVVSPGAGPTDGVASLGKGTTDGVVVSLGAGGCHGWGGSHGRGGFLLHSDSPSVSALLSTPRL